jgi:hypothetical protein
MVRKLMRPLGDRISGGRRGARGFGYCRMNCRFGLRLPGASARVWAYRIGTSREHAAPRKRRSTTCGRQIVRCHPKFRPVHNRVRIETANPRQSGAEWSGCGGIDAAVSRAQLCFNIPNGVGLGTAFILKLPRSGGRSPNRERNRPLCMRRRMRR